MKASAGLLCLLIFFKVRHFVAAPVELLRLGKNAAECVKDFHLDGDKILTMGTPRMLLAPENDADLSSFMGCYWQKVGLQNPANGEINYDKLEKLLQTSLSEELALAGSSSGISTTLDLLKKAMGYCKSTSHHGKTYGQTAVQVQNCVMGKLDQLTEEYLKYS